MNQHDPRGVTGPALTRRGLLQTLTASGLLVLSGPILTACADDTTASKGGGSGKRGGRLRVGVAGGSAKDTIDAHLGGTTDPDVARGIQLFEPLAMRDKDFRLEMLLAESIEPHEGSADKWAIRIREGVTFHNGKTMDLD